VVLANVDYSLLEQDRCLQDQVTQGQRDRTAILIPSIDRWKQVPLEKYFPEYTGGDDINKAAKYILWRFMQANRARLSVYPQCAHVCFVCF
jgi:hypothetical protein